MIPGNFELSPPLMLLCLFTVVMLGFFFKKSQSYLNLRTVVPRSVTANKRKFASALDRPLSIEQIKADKMTHALNRIWDMKGLRDEVSRLHMRAVKKIDKVNERIAKDTVAASDELRLTFL